MLMRIDSMFLVGVLVEDCGYTLEDLKNMWGLADTILRNDKVYYICMKLIDVEIQN